jgi:UDP-N-acetylmuramoylalanine--D-glutamate ligase
MSQAVNLAAERAQTGDVVLLSPACASLDMYTNYKARAQAFIDAVQELGLMEGQL